MTRGERGPPLRHGEVTIGRLEGNIVDRPTLLSPTQLTLRRDTLPQRVLLRRLFIHSLWVLDLRRVGPSRLRSYSLVIRFRYSRQVRTKSSEEVFPSFFEGVGAVRRGERFHVRYISVWGPWFRLRSQWFTLFDDTTRSTIGLSK